VAPTDQASFANPQGSPDPIPIKTPGAASGDGIGGTVTGDVGQPISVITDGLHAASMDLDWNTFNLVVSASFTPSSVTVGGNQAFVGTDSGSPNLPTISGTPVFLGGFNSGSRAKLAAKIDMINGVDFYGLGIATDPDLHFVNSTSRIVPAANEYLATIPL